MSRKAPSDQAVDLHFYVRYRTDLDKPDDHSAWAADVVAVTAARRFQTSMIAPAANLDNPQ
jgi:hypothetical protein